MALVKNLIAQVPYLFDLEKARSLRPITYNESMSTVLYQELLRYNNLIQMMRTSLQNTALALDGIIVMTPDLEVMCDS